MRICSRASMIMAVWMLVMSSTESATLDQILEKMRSDNPAFKQAKASVGITEGFHLQAGLRSNPSLSVENEEMPLNRLGSLRRCSTTVAMSQSFDSWNKRAVKLQTASKDVALAEIDLHMLELEISSQVCQTFALLLLTQERENLLLQFRDGTQLLMETVTTQVQSGERPIMEQLRVQAEVHEIEVRQHQHQSETHRLAYQLAALLGETSPTFLPLTGSLDSFLLPMSSDELISLLDRHPAVQAQHLQLDKALLEQRSAARDWLPDPEFTLGIEANRAENANTLVFGVSLPLPLFNRNQGLLQAASASTDRAHISLEATRLNLASEIHALSAQSSTLKEALLTHEQMTLPQLRKVSTLIFEGYRMGEFGYLEVVESQSAQIEAEMRRLEIIEDLLEVQSQLVSLDRFLKNRERNNE